ncbi:cell envelope integrity protein TolA [Lacimicrobium sp. SS2-24]|uniref:cell envelope integrity protein TolA n=1 Tax=Lacimicrobium sp. SS2-24 TaxID=2005569 RepID=UPI000B4BFA2E|nr:cell envelope integrity protein TolA [Lacimicrobium sp. SS2-24]
MQSLKPALAWSGLLHLVMGGLLVVSIDFSSIPEVTQPQVNLVQAVVVDSAVIERQFEKIEQQKEAERQRLAEIERRAREAEQRRREAIEEAKEAKKRQQQEAQRRAQAEAAAKKKAQEERERAKRLEQERQRKAKEEAERKAREAEERRKREEAAAREAERKRQEEAARAEQERLMQEQLRAEQAARQQQRQRQILSETDKYRALIMQAIQRNWIIDDSMRGKSCRLNISVASNGFVKTVRILEGDPRTCKSAETAVYKTATLPVPKDPEVLQQFLNFNLTVKRD